jgi:hypothetical protein
MGHARLTFGDGVRIRGWGFVSDVKKWTAGQASTTRETDEGSGGSRITELISASHFSEFPRSR